MCSTIPGENPREFKQLHSHLIDEWRPSGPTEEDAVFSLADLMWRKRRAQRFIQAKLETETFVASSRHYVERRGLALFGCFMVYTPEITFDKSAKILLSADRISHFEQKCPRSNYKSTSEWAAAVIWECYSILVSVGELKPGDKPDVLPEVIDEFITGLELINAVQEAKELFEDELNLRRLEAMIDRKVKYLLQLKAMKQMLRQTSAAREDEQPKTITARRGLQ
jgi:hypothetical protein